MKAIAIDHFGATPALRDVPRRRSTTPHRELGSAFGIAILGSAFNSGYRSSIAGSLRGLPASVAAAGQSLVTAARDAFITGRRDAMLIGTAILLVGAAYVAIRGGHATANQHDPDDALDEAEDADQADQAALAPALATAPPRGHSR